MAEVKKTAKYYRDIFNGSDTRKAIALLPEVIKKFGDKDYEGKRTSINIRKYTKFNWNHRIEKFHINNKGIALADIYWQGDSTDGNECEYVSDLINGKVISGEYFFDGYRTHETHSDLRITREEFLDALKAVGKFLSPENMKARKEAERRDSLATKIFNLIDSQVDHKDREFWNGRWGVQKLLEKEPDLYNKTFEELTPIVLKVFRNNNHSDYYLENRNGVKEYNLAY